MKAFIALFSIFVVAVVYAADEPDSVLAELKKTCASDHNVTAEQLEKLHTDNFITNIEDVKCFTKCLLNKSGVLSDKGVDVEKVVGFAGLKKLDPIKVRKNAEECKELFKGSNDCETALALLACFNKVKE